MFVMIRKEKAPLGIDVPVRPLPTDCSILWLPLQLRVPVGAEDRCLMMYLGTLLTSPTPFLLCCMYRAKPGMVCIVFDVSPSSS